MAEDTGKIMRTRSSKPRKQRKFLYTAPLHLRRKMLASHLSKELREKYKRRSLPIRKGDEIQIMTGEHKGKTGKISRVDLKRYRVYVEGITIKRSDGTERQISLHPSNLKIINLNLDDKRRIRILERKVKIEKPKEEKHETKEAVGTKVLESTKESNKVDSGT